jgi:hypothetical protein
MKLLIMPFSPASYYFLPRSFKSLPQQPVLRQSKSVFGIIYFMDIAHGLVLKIKILYFGERSGSRSQVENRVNI